MRQLLWWMRARHMANSGAVAFAPPPLLESVTPATGSQAGGTTITLRGNLLDSATRVLVGGVDCTDVRRVNSRQCTAVTPAGTGTQAVTVLTGGGQSTLAAAYAYASGAPTVLGVSPSTGTSLGGTAVTITGTAFTGATAVTFAGVAATSVVVVNATTITCVTPAGTPSAAVTVAVTTPGGTGSLGSAFTYNALPTVSAITPNVIDTAGGGQAVTITGTGLTGTTAVTIGGTAATSVTVINSTTVTCVPGARSAGASLSVVVTATNGSNVANTLAEYWTPSQITGIDTYLDSNKGVTITTNVSTWTSQSAGSTAYTQATVGSRPSQVASVFGTLPAIRFAPQQWVACTRRTLASGFSIFAVVKTSATTASAGGLNPGTTVVGDANAANGYIQFGMSNGVVALHEFSGGTAITTRGSGFNDNAARLIGATHSSSTDIQTLYQGATQQGTTATVTYPSLGGYEAVGTGYANADGWNGDLGAVVVASGVISGSDLTKLNSWARQRFGTP